MLKVKKMHHVAIICSDYNKSKEFYVSILGFKIIREVYREERKSYKLDIEKGDIQLELFSFENSPKRLSYPEACGLRHLAFESEDLENDYIYLKENKVNIETIRVDEYTNKKFFFFFDPDGLPIEIYQG